MTEHPRKVLIIEDNPIDGEVYSQSLGAARGADLSIALERTGRSGITRQGSFHADCIVLDFNLPDIVLDMSMPEMNGKQVMQHIRRLGIGVPVLICSGYSESEVYREFMGLDIAGFLQKPFTARQLASKIEGVLRHKPTGLQNR
jgi:CheY-like chemotaxis protein